MKRLIISMLAVFTLFGCEEDASQAEYWQVTWALNGGAWKTGYTPETKAVKGGTLAEPTAPEKTGSTFEGWYKEATLTTQINFPYNVSAVTVNFTLYAKWSTGSVSDCSPAGYEMFTSISALKTALAAKSANTAETAYKVGLKNVNLDANNNWGDLGLAINGSKYVDLTLQCCTGTGIPDGYSESKG